MPEIPDQVGGQTAEAAWANLIRDRAMMRYANAAARDAAEVGPLDGRFCFLEDEDAVYQRAAGAWVQISDKFGSPLSKADLNPQTVDGPVTFDAAVTFPTTFYPENQRSSDYIASGNIDGERAMTNIVANDVAGAAGRVFWVVTTGWIAAAEDSLAPGAAYDITVRHRRSTPAFLQSKAFMRIYDFGGTRVFVEPFTLQDLWTPSAGAEVLSSYVSSNTYPTPGNLTFNDITTVAYLLG